LLALLRQLVPSLHPPCMPNFDFQCFLSAFNFSLSCCTRPSPWFPSTNFFLPRPSLSTIPFLVTFPLVYFSCCLPRSLHALLRFLLDRVPPFSFALVLLVPDRSVIAPFPILLYCSLLYLRSSLPNAPRTYFFRFGLHYVFPNPSPVPSRVIVSSLGQSRFDYAMLFQARCLSLGLSPFITRLRVT